MSVDWSTTLLQTKISQQLFDGLLWDCTDIINIATTNNEALNNKCCRSIPVHLITFRRRQWGAQGWNAVVAWHGAGWCGASPRAPPPASSAPCSDAQRASQCRLEAGQPKLQLSPPDLGPGQLCLCGGQTALSLAQLQAGESRGVLGCLGAQGQVLGFILQLLLTASRLLQLSSQFSLAGPPACLRLHQALLNQGKLHWNRVNGRKSCNQSCNQPVSKRRTWKISFHLLLEGISSHFSFS